MNGIIYLVTNLINNKQYIGQTRVSLQRRWKKHQSIAKNYYNGKRKYISLLSQAIIKYKIESFKIEILEENINLIDLDNKETEYINKYNTLSPNGYNLIAIGNNANLISVETRSKLSKSLSGKNNPMYGKTHSDEMKANMRQRMKNPSEKLKLYWESLKTKTGPANPSFGIPCSDERKRKIAEKAKGRIVSEDTKLKMSLSRQGKYKGPLNSIYGIKQSEETKLKRIKTMQKNKMIKEVMLVDGESA